MKLIWDELKKIQKRLSGRKKIFFLDFDGSLAAIADDPGSVFLDEEMKKVLSGLTRLRDTRVCVISGRALHDLKKIISNERIVCVGNHGLEMTAHDPLCRVSVSEFRIFLGILEMEMTIHFRRVSGIVVENKTYSMSLHYRNVPRSKKELFRHKLESVRENTKFYPLEWRHGKKAWEIRPLVSWNKGTAAARLLSEYRGAVAIVLGDDMTDEDMFTALNGDAIKVRVGFSRKSRADYYLKAQGEVKRFLSAFLVKKGKEGTEGISSG